MTRRLSSFLLVAALGAAIGCGDDDSADDDTSENPSTGDGVCGDGTVDDGEQCDDGDNMSGDGCSSTCKKEGDAGGGSGKADASIIDSGSRGSIDAGRGDSGGGAKPGDSGNGGGAPDASKGDAGSGVMDAGVMPSMDSGSEPASADLCTGEPADECETCSCGACETQFTACVGVEGVASEGPGAGKEKSDLCQAVVRCGQENGCRGEACFCGVGADGGVDLIGCLTGAGPIGPCKDEIFAAAETEDAQMVAGRRTDQNFALNFANDVSACTTNSCAAACGM